MMRMIRSGTGEVVPAVFYVLFAAIVLLIAGCRSTEYELTVYKAGEGWGYDICSGGKAVIHQPFVPALPGNMPFPDKASAKAAGRLVREKLSAGETPSLSKDEIYGIIR